MQINAVLVTLNISHWEANRQDSKASREVAEANDVKENRMCRVRKSLLPKTEVLDRLYATIRAARTFHYRNTHGWLHDGPRILPITNYDAYMARMRQFKVDFEAVVLDLLDQYDEVREEAKKVLGKLYDERDYPSRDKLATRYRIEIGVQPMPAAMDLMTLGVPNAEELCKKLEADVAETLQTANRQMWMDLFERVEKLYKKLADDKAFVKEETIAAVRSRAELIPRMNITGDMKLETLARDLVAALEGVTDQALKVNYAMREKACAALRSAYHTMQAHLHGSKPASSHMLRLAA